jgi:hypothetical protein
MKTTKPALAAFMSALTDTDRLPASERERANRIKLRDDRTATRDARHRTWLLAQAAYHRAHAGHYEALNARFYNRRRRAEVEAAYAEACRQMTDAVEEFMAVPFQNDGDRKERAVLIRKWSKALGASGASGVHREWIAAQQDWLAKIGGAA